jgi:hypothetical protein
VRRLCDASSVDGAVLVLLSVAENRPAGHVVYTIPRPDDPDDPLALNVTYRIISVYSGVVACCGCDC